MSTKIYYAFRVPVSAFPAFLAEFRGHALGKAKHRVGEIMGREDVEPEMRSIYEKNGWAKTMTWGEFVSKKERTFQVRDALRKVKAASISSARDLEYCIDCSLNCWIYKGRAYCIPYGEAWLHEGFRLPARAEDFSYWDSSEGPEEISHRDWRNRGKVWDKVCLSNWDSGRLVHEIINAKENIGLHYLASRFVSNDDAWSAIPD